MTKLKSKKMSKSTFAVIIMAIAMVAMIAFGGTYAYFTAAATTTAKTAKFGKVALTATDNLSVVTATGAVPGDKIFEGKVTFANTSTVDTIVIANFKVTYTGYVWTATETLEDKSFAEFVELGENDQPKVAPVANGTNGFFYTVSNMPIKADDEVLGGFTIDTNAWTKVSDKAAYLCGKEGEGYRVEASESAYLLGSADANAVVALSTKVDRHFENGEYVGSEGDLLWEGATIEMTISFDQIQYDNIAGLTYHETTKDINEEKDKIYAVVNAILHPVAP